MSFRSPELRVTRNSDLSIVGEKRSRSSKQLCHWNSQNVNWLAIEIIPRIQWVCFANLRFFCPRIGILFRS